MALATQSKDHQHSNIPASLEHDAGVDWVRLMSALRSHALFVVAVTVVGTAAAVGASRLIRPSYIVEARLWIEASSPAGAMSGPIQSRQLFETTAWEELLRSYRVLEQVVRDQRLYLGVPSGADSVALADLSIGEEIVPGAYVLRVDSSATRFVLSTQRGRVVDEGLVGDSVGRQVGLQWVHRPGSIQADETVEFSLRTVRDAARDLAMSLQSQMDSKGNFLRVTLHGPDPVGTTAALSAVVMRFVRVAGELKRATLSERTRILTEQLDTARQRLDLAERALESFRVRTITLPGQDRIGGSGEATSSLILGAYFTLLSDREDLRRARAALGQTLRVAEAGSFPVEMLEGIPLIRESAEMEILLDELAKKRAELRELRYRFTDESQAVQQLLQEISDLENGALPAQVRSLDSELSRRQAAVEAEIAGQGESLQRIPPRTLQEAQLGRDVALAQELYGTLQKRFEEARLAEVSSIPDVRILDFPAVPRDPESEQARRIIAMAFLATLGTGILGAIVLDRIDPRLRYPVQVTRELGLNILGGVPRLKNGRGRRARESRAQLLESFRSLRLSLVHSYGSAGPMVLTVTSPEQGDGKSFVATNLGEVFARQGQRVVVVDCDLRRGRQHEVVGGPRSPGLTEYLEGRASADQVIHRSGKRTMDFVPAGEPRLNSGEMLSSRRLGIFLSHLKARYEVVLLDTPPLRAGVDALALSTLAGNLLFVLRTGATDRTVAESKLELLDQLPVRVLGAVLNDIRGQEGAYRHYAYDSYYTITEGEALLPAEAGLRLPSPSGVASQA